MRLMLFYFKSATSRLLYMRFMLLSFVVGIRPLQIKTTAKSSIVVSRSLPFFRQPYKFDLTWNTCAMSTSDTIIDDRPACVPCSSLDASHVLSIQEIRNKVEHELPLWNVLEKSNSENEKTSSYFTLSRSFTARNFQCALDFINSVGAIAEQEQHHPNLHLTSYREIEIELYTHKLSGVTENDILLAKMIDSNVQVEYSPKWLKDHPEAESTSK
jgi:pterin-4a-carbinolamine dehydratase